MTKTVPISSTSKEYRILDQTGAYTNSKAIATYGSFNIKTNFACSGVTEYTANAVYLITQLLMPNGQSYSFTYENNPVDSNFKTGRIKKVTLPTGGSYEYDYPTTGNNGIYCTDGSVTSLTRIITDDTAAYTWQFTRSGTGNSTTTETAPALPYDNNVSNTMVFTFSGTSVTSQKIYQGPTTGTLLRTINTSYAANGTPSVTTTILEDQAKQTKVETDYDSYANLLEKREYAWGSTTLVRRTTMTYLTGSGYTTANILKRVTRVTVKDGSGTPISRTDITYDAYGGGNANMVNVTGALQHNDASYGQSFTYRGNPTSVTTYTNGAGTGPITTNVYYDTLGNVRKTDVGGTLQNQMVFSSTTQYSFPDSVTRGPSSPQLITSATYDPKTGLVKTSTDENIQGTQYTYDNLRRLTDIQRPDSAHIAYAYDDPNKKVTVTSPVQSTDVVKQISYLDSLGRVYRTTTADSGNTAYSSTDTQFDSLGRAYKVSNPYTGSASYWTETDTDALGRVTKTTLPDSNQTTYAYVLSTVTITDPAGHQTKRDADAQGRLVTVYEPDVTQGNTLTIQTSYNYTVLDRITQVTQGTLGRTYGYDGLGRMTTATDPETGYMQYSYNSFNQMATRTDALGVITTYYYDTLNRPYQIIYNVGTSGVPATATVTYYYGITPAQYNNGRLITLDTAGIETDSFTYDQMGTVHSVGKNITGAQTYGMTYGYNLAGQVKTITYPSGRVVTQGLDTIGRLSSISDGTRTYANTFTFNPAGQMTNYTAGNTVQGTFGYSDSRLQLGAVTYTKGANTLFSLSYGYAQPNGGNNGQITAITDNMTSAYSLSFTYDALGRLTNGTTANTTSPNTWAITWGYDTYGNRKTQSETAGTLPVTNESVMFDAHNCITSGFACGASGNMTNDGVTSNYVYDAENRYVKQGSTLINTYDGSSLRIKKVTGSSTVVYVYSGSQVIAEYDPAALVTAPTKEYIYLGSQILAALDAAHNPTYRHTDHLSGRLYSDNSGTVIGTQGHLPWGEAWYSTGTVDKWKFTTYERDTDTSLDYAINRFNSARLARFMTPDPYGGSIDAGNPQSWNRYPYVLNDPVNLIDPLGLCGSGASGDPPCKDPVGQQVDVTDTDPGEVPFIYTNMPHIPGLFLTIASVDDTFGGRLLGVSLPISALAPANNGTPPQPPQPPQDPNSPNYGAGLCAATPTLQLRHFGGCAYVCEFVYDDPFDVRIGGTHAPGRVVDAACGPGRFCPALLVVEKDNPGAVEPVRILSCTP